jgi:hypothetical protein
MFMFIHLSVASKEVQLCVHRYSYHISHITYHMSLPYHMIGRAGKSAVSGHEELHTRQTQPVVAATNANHLRKHTILTINKGDSDGQHTPLP